MLTIKELYQKALKESTGNEDFKYDPSQLNCLFEPKEYPINWKLSDILTPAGIPLSGTTITKDTLAVLNALASHKGKRAFILIAPAFLGQFSDQVSPGMIRTAFKKIGFNGLIEVAVFADILTLREALEFDKLLLPHVDCHDQKIIYRFNAACASDCISHDCSWANSKDTASRCTYCFCRSVYGKKSGSTRKRYCRCC